jgi:hypothetical protein
VCSAFWRALGDAAAVADVLSAAEYVEREPASAANRVPIISQARLASSSAY